MAKSFHLRWNNHLNNLQQLMEYLYNEQSFVDVTLSCSDGLIRAHKLVLSACSPYFDTIFKENPCKHPTVILKGVGLREMQSIIEYMYVGSVDVFEENLSALLEAANELHVKGLVQVPTENTSEEGPSQQQSDQTPATNATENVPLKVAAKSSPPVLPTVKRVTVPVSTRTLESSSATYGHFGHLPMNVDEGEYIGHCDEEREHSSMTLGYAVSPGEDVGSPETFCQMCDRQFLTKQNMKRHMQTHTGEKPHKCEYCELSFLRLSHLQRHHRVHTGERPFSCESCEKNFARSDKLKQHVIQHHSGLVAAGRQNKSRGRPRKPEGALDSQTDAMEGIMQLDDERATMNDAQTMMLAQQMRNYNVGGLPVAQAQ